MPALLLEGEDPGPREVAQAEELAAGSAFQQHAQVPQHRLQLGLEGEGRAAAQQLLGQLRALALLRAGAGLLPRPGTPRG